MHTSSNVVGRHVVICALALSLVGCRTSDPRTPVYSPELVRLTTELSSAILERDMSKLLSLIAPDCQLHFSDKSMTGGRILAPRPDDTDAKPWFIRLVKNLSLVPLHSAIVDARAYGDVGVVVSYYNWTGTLYGEHFSTEGYATHIWVRNRGRWKMIMLSADAMH